MSNDKLRYVITEIRDFLTNKRFILNLVGILLFLILVFLVIFGWLRSYTHHGQKLELPDYVGMQLDEAKKDAKARSFEVIVNDSVFIVNQKGGLVRNQNPSGGSWVKEDRKVYVTITKHTPDQVSLSDMRFFGEDFDQIRAQLQNKSVFTEVKARKFDPLTKNSVLEVWYKGDKIVDRRLKPKDLVINKGETLSFVISGSEGGLGTVPPLNNRTVETARFILGPEGLELTVVNPQGLDEAAINSSRIIGQDPTPQTDLPRGSVIKVTIADK